MGNAIASKATKASLAFLRLGITPTPPVGVEGINPLDLALALSWPE